MNEARNILEDIINNFAVEKFGRFFREKNGHFVAHSEDFQRFAKETFQDGLKIGEINVSETERIIVASFKCANGLTERSGKKAQYEKAKEVLKAGENRVFNAGIFIFHDEAGRFRFSLVYAEAHGTKRQWNHFRRSTYFVSAEYNNKTFKKQIGDGDLGTLSKIKEAFSITAVTNLFYDEFFKVFNGLVTTVKKTNKIDNEDRARDFVLLFAIRTIFIGFIQKKHWIGNDEKFIENLYKEYAARLEGKNEFYARWLTPLFFEALNNPPGHKVAYGNNDYSPATEGALQMAPYLNGGLFKEKRDYDSNGWMVPDKEIKEFLDFLFAHSFTIEENSLDDEDLQLNPEFLGIIFERLVNKADGAVYTPRTEVDLMCRLGLVKWLEKNLESKVRIENLYELFFKESEKEEDQKGGSFSKNEAVEIIGKLENLAICDPAVGSGAFLVGMMQVLDEVEQSLKKRHDLNGVDQFVRKKQIIKNSLYGVEVKEWAVWICQLRLWLSLFVDAPDELKNSLEPILPSLDFKVRQGDSLVQRVGSKTFPIAGHSMAFSRAVKDKITKLKNLKLEYYDNRSALKDWELRQREIAIYDEIIGVEIKEKEDSLSVLKSEKPKKTMSMFETDEKPETITSESNQVKIEALENEIAELNEQRQALKAGAKPLVWSIEFAEIFAEKGGFDIVIGNPPYVRQEAIADPMGKIKDKREYKRYLEEMARLDFPYDFPPQRKINAQSDLYTYFYIRSLGLFLNNRGIHVFICSNSWLDVGYGVWLQKFLLDRAAIEFIIDNQAKRSFAAADVNTIISVINAPLRGAKKYVPDSHLVKFVAMKKPFEEVIYTENLLAIEQAKEVVSNENFRVYPITNQVLRETGTEYDNEEQKKVYGGKYIGDKWGGKYLRAPDIFFTILEKGKGKLVKLGNIAEVRFGIKTGCNEFFYLTDAKAKELGIEQEFLRPVIKSPRECKSILIEPKNLKYKIFICNKSKEELKGTNALKYIEWGEKQKFNRRPSCSSRTRWWSLSILNSTIVWPSTYNPVYKIFYNPTKICIDKVFYGIESNEDSKLLSTMVSYLFALQTEIYGYALVGGGGLFTTVEDLERILVVSPKFIKNSNEDQYEKIIPSIYSECGINPGEPIDKQNPRPEHNRAELDKIVFDALGLTVDERKEVYRAVCRLVWYRISKAKSV